MKRGVEEVRSLIKYPGVYLSRMSKSLFCLLGLIGVCGKFFFGGVLWEALELLGNDFEAIRLG